MKATGIVAITFLLLGACGGVIGCGDAWRYTPLRPLLDEAHPQLARDPAIGWTSAEQGTFAKVDIMTVRKR